MIKGVFILLILTILFGCKTETKGPSIQIATASNMQFAMDSLVTLFESEFDIHCDISTNSSGMLTAQIENGAPFDVFVSANMKYPKKLMASNFAQTPIIYAYGRLVFVFSKQLNFKTIEEALYSDKIKRIAVAEKKTAPYGIAALHYLDSIQFFNKAPRKIVYGESIGQVNQYIKSQAVDAGFTSFSFIQNFSEDYHYLEVDPSFFDEIQQGACMLKHGAEKNQEASQKFINFLTSSEGVSVLKHFGYLVK